MHGRPVGKQNGALWAHSIVNLLVVIVISELLERHAKAKRTRAPAYSPALRRIKGFFPKGSPW